MFEKLRDKLRNSGKAGTVVTIAAVVLVLAGVVWLARSSFGPSSAAQHNASRVYICAETGKTFTYDVKPGKLFPVMSPHSGKETGYPAQQCYWTADGKLKAEPTYVLMNSYRNVKGPTFCPDCNRLVAADNPVAAEGSPPPPTKDEYEKRRASRRGGTAEGEDQ